MTMRRLFFLAMGCCLTAPLAAQDAATMLQRVPASANVVASIDISGLMQSDLGARQGWQQKRNMDYYAGRVPFPPSAKFVVSASEYTPAERRCAWQIALMHFDTKVDPYIVAKKEGSEVTWVDKLFVIPSRRNAYFVEFDRNNYGTYAPANKQQFARWVQYAKGSSRAGVSQYLIDTLQQGGSFGQITIAMDLSNFLDKAEVQERLKHSKVLADAKADTAAWANLIAGIKGLRLSLRSTTEFTAELQLDFDEKTAPFVEKFPDLLEEVIQRIGLGITEAGNWKCQARGNSMVLTGGIQVDEVRRLISLIVPLSPNVEGEESDTVSTAQAAVTTSQRYFRAVDTLLTELRNKSDTLGAKQQWQNMATWHEYTASKIDQLPHVNTDPELMQYASTTAARIRMMSESLRGVSIQDKVLDTYRRYGYNYGDVWGGYWGSGGYWDNKQQVDSAKAENAAAGAKDRNLLWRMIGDDTTKIRQTMAKKYNAEF